MEKPPCLLFTRWKSRLVCSSRDGKAALSALQKTAEKCHLTRHRNAGHRQQADAREWRDWGAAHELLADIP
jgi:hypothetical protein